MTRISARGVVLKASVAMQNMQVLDTAIRDVAWATGASQVVFMDNCGGFFRTDLAAKSLIINFTDEQSTNDIVFNSPTGKAFYELDSIAENRVGSYIRGNDRPIINGSSATMTQLYTLTSEDGPNIVLCYRPQATAVFIGINNSKAVNLIRIYIINLNSSWSLGLREKSRLRATTLNVTTTTHQYEFNQSTSSLALKASFDGTTGTIWLPITSGVEGAYVNLETVVCNIRLQTVEV